MTDTQAPTLLTDAESFRLALCGLGLCPTKYDTPAKAVQGVTEIVEKLRRELADPPPDVQELVLKKLGLDIAAIQRAALSEARQRVISRYEQIDGWLEKPLPEDIRTNWEGLSDGLRQARRLIGGMWDELPIASREGP